MKAAAKAKSRASQSEEGPVEEVVKEPSAGQTGSSRRSNRASAAAALVSHNFVDLTIMALSNL